MSVKGWLCSFLGFIATFGAPAANAGGLTEKQYNDVTEQFLEKFKPEADRLGVKLAVDRHWSDETVNAWVRMDQKLLTITTYGGLARHPAITPDGYALVLCAEAAALFGGTPKVSQGYWIVMTGQRDYYSTLKCLRRVFADDDNVAAVRRIEVDPLVARRCKREFAQVNDQLICQRSSMAGLSAALLFHDLVHDGEKLPSFKTPDPTEVDRTGPDHLTSQCRLDSYFAGALCHVDVNTPVSEANERQGVCNDDEDEFGARPRCWYRPTSPQILK